MKTSLRFCGGVTALVALGTVLYEPDAVADSDVTNDCQVRGEIPTNSRPADGGGPFSINIGGSSSAAEGVNPAVPAVAGSPAAEAANPATAAVAAELA